jgi:hypothetical protein
MNRRNFINNAAIMSAAGLLCSSELFARSPLLDKIGIQFFSLPKMLEKDLKGTFAMLSKMGYKEVELYGPYPFSTGAAQQRWDAVTPSLGFKGSGYFGHTAAEIKAMLKDNGLAAPSMHTDLDTLQARMDKLYS